MSFESSVLQWAIGVVAIVLSIVLALDHGRRRRVLQRVGKGETFARMANSLSSKRRAFRSVLYILACMLCLAALAQPTSPGEATWRQRGIDIAFVYDFSSSMLAGDVYPSRLERSLKEAENLQAKLKADRVASVVYAGGAVHFPLTHDHEAARLLYQGLRPTDLAPGSDLGQALRVASCVLRAEAAPLSSCDHLGPGQGGRALQGQSPALRAEAPPVSERARAIVLFSDGEDSAGFALAEAELIASLDIQLYVIAVGTKAGELVPSLDAAGNKVGWQKDPEGAFVTTKLESQRLQKIAKAASGRYLSLGEGRWRGELLLESLKELKRGDLDRRVIATRKPIYARFLFPAFLLLIIEACMSERRRRTRLPVVEGGDE